MAIFEKLFSLHSSGSSLKREIIGGLTTFMTMSYIIFVQPAVLSACGMNKDAVIVATCVASAIATFLMGILANYPIALAPAMGHNFYFTYVVCIGMGISWQVALGANFISGAIFILLAFFGLREKRKRKKERPSLIMRTGTRYLFTAALLFGAYVFVHGHLTPGGGFPGGVIVATAFLMLFLAQEGFRVSEKGVRFVEALAGMTYVAIGIAGLLLVGSFLGNFLGTGIPNKLASAGIIPLIYITIGLKVGSEITGLLQNMRETTEYES